MLDALGFVFCCAVFPVLGLRSWTCEPAQASWRFIDGAFSLILLLRPAYMLIRLIIDTRRRRQYEVTQGGVALDFADTRTSFESDGDDHHRDAQGDDDIELGKRVVSEHTVESVFVLDDDDLPPSTPS